MEFFIILIVVVVLFNLIGSLFTREQRKQAPAARPVPSRFRVVYDEPEAFRREPAGTGTAPEGKPAAPVSGPDRQVPREESLPAGDTGTAATNLQRTFSDSNRLVAGFVFNEILQPPRGLRRRRGL